MNKKDLISKRNKQIAVNRWKREHDKCYEHIKTISKNKEFEIFKSRLLGFLAGDGSVLAFKEKNRKNVTHHVIAFYPDHDSMIKPYIEGFDYLYNKKPFIKLEKNHYSIKCYSKPACLDLLNTISLGTYKWEVPFKFLKLRESKIEWLKALFDCEASVLKRQIQVQSVNERGLLQIKKLLEEFSIESKIYKYKRENPNWNTNYILCIMKRDSRQKFLNEIGFNHKLKFKKLNNILKASVPKSG